MTMLSHSINQLLQDNHKIQLDITEVKKGRRVELADLHIALGASPLFIADQKSWMAATHFLSDTLIEEALRKLIILDAPASPDLDKTIPTLIDTVFTQNHTSISIIGSGSLSDIGKYIASKCALPLAIIATAPSMNGYTSANASLIRGGMKQSFQAKLAEQVIVSEDILHHAPPHMRQAGISDAFASVSADIDWQIVSELTDSYYDASIFKAQQPYFEHITQSNTHLIHLLMLQGLAMTINKSSTPASGGEHMLAHILELRYPELCKHLLHGELIAITHAVYLTYQLEMLKCNSPIQLRANHRQAEDFFSDIWHIIEPLAQKKLAMHANNRELIHNRLRRHWRPIKEKLIQQKEEEIKLASQHTNNVKNHGELKFKAEEIIPYAYLARDRFTMLDFTVAT